MLQNVVAGLQGIIDHAMVGHYVGFHGNAAIGVSWQIFLVVVVFISSIFTGMSVLVARFAGADDHDRVNRTVYQAFLTAMALALHEHDAACAPFFSGTQHHAVRPRIERERRRAGRQDTPAALLAAGLHAQRRG